MEDRILTLERLPLHVLHNRYRERVYRLDRMVELNVPDSIINYEVRLIREAKIALSNRGSDAILDA